MYTDECFKQLGKIVYSTWLYYNHCYCLAPPPVLFFPSFQTQNPKSQDNCVIGTINNQNIQARSEPPTCFHFIQPKVQVQKHNCPQSLHRIAQNSLKNTERWTVSESRKLRKLARQNMHNWQLVCRKLDGRDAAACEQHYIELTHLNQRKEWTPNEDAKLLHLVEMRERKWSTICREFNECSNVGFGRTTKQIRQRYMNYLQPGISREKWTTEEDVKLSELVQTYGRKWKMFETQLPGRRENSIKNRFYSFLKARMNRLNRQVSSKNPEGKEGAGNQVSQ